MVRLALITSLSSNKVVPDARVSTPAPLTVTVEVGPPKLSAGWLALSKVMSVVIFKVWLPVKSIAPFPVTVVPGPIVVMPLLIVNV
jgi:hypothetical protein